MLKSLRERANRDDGRLFQIGNRQVGYLEAIGHLSLIFCLLSWHFHEKSGLSIFWSVWFGVGGFLIYILHVFLTMRRSRPPTAAAEIDR